MKSLIVLALAAGLMAGCGRPAPGPAPVSPEPTATLPVAPARPRERDRQLDQLAAQLATELTSQKVEKIAVIEFSCLGRQAPALGTFLAEELTTRLFRTGRYQIIERRLLDKMLAEQKLGASGLLDEADASQLGHILGVDALLTGTAVDLDTSVKVNARLIAAESGMVFAVADADLPMDPELAALMGRKAGEGVPEATGRFDGLWLVAIACAAGEGAQGYNLHVQALVRNGALHGSLGREGVAPYINLDGRIGPDGKGVILATGLTGNSRFNLYSVRQGLPFFYHIDAAFQATQGTGRRRENRKCDVAFTKQ